MKLDLPNDELRAMVQGAIERLICDEYSAAIEAVAMEQARERMKWRSTSELAEEFRIPERTIRFLHEQGKLTKSLGLGEKQPRFLREDILHLIDSKQIRSATTMAREREAGRKVALFRNGTDGTQGTDVRRAS